MLMICCPWCGEREQTEFAYFGEAHLLRPPDPAVLSDEDWSAYLFLRKNTKGAHFERWMHAAGCRQFFNMARHTVSGKIFGTYPPGGSPPDTADTAGESVVTEATETTADTADTTAGKPTTAKSADTVGAAGKSVAKVAADGSAAEGR